MNNGYIVAALGVLAIIVGGAMYAMDYHHTIGEGGIGLGVVLLIVGLWLSMRKPAPKPAPAPAPTT